MGSSFCVRVVLGILLPIFGASAAPRSRPTFETTRGCRVEVLKSTSANPHNVFYSGVPASRHRDAFGRMDGKVGETKDSLYNVHLKMRITTMEGAEFVVETGPEQDHEIVFRNIQLGEGDGVSVKLHLPGEYPGWDVRHPEEIVAPILKLTLDDGNEIFCGEFTELVSSGLRDK